MFSTNISFFLQKKKLVEDSEINTVKDTTLSGEEAVNNSAVEKKKKKKKKQVRFK